MAVLIVKRLEMIQIQEQHGTKAAAALTGSHRLFQSVCQQTAIGQLRQCVTNGQVADVAFAFTWSAGDFFVSTHRRFKFRSVR